MAPKKCKTGKSCGMGCISSTKTCRVQLSPQVSEVLDKKVDKPPQTIEDIELKAYDEVKSKKLRKQATTSAGTEVKVLIIGGGVVFFVGGTMNRDEAQVPDPIAAGKLAMRLAKELIEELPDGVVLWNSPYLKDSGGDARVRVYQKLGFGGVIEKDQWAVKLNGRLVPVTEEFYRKHIEEKKWGYKGM